MTRRTVPYVIIALLLPGSDLDPFLSIHMFFGANRWLTIDIGHFVLPHYGRIFRSLASPPQRRHQSLCVVGRWWHKMD